MSEPELNFNGNEFRFIALWNNKAMKLIENESIQEKIREAKIKAIENPVIGYILRDLTEKYEKEAVYVVKSKFPLLGWAPKACKVVDSREVWAKLVDYWTYDLILESVVEKSGFSKFALTKKDSVIEWLNHLNELMNFNDKDAHRFLLLKVLYPFHPSIRPVNGVDN